VLRVVQARVLLEALNYADDDADQHRLSTASASVSESRRPSGAAPLDKSYGVARLLGCCADVVLLRDEVHAQADAWCAGVVAHAQRLLDADAFRKSHNGVVSAAAVHAIAVMAMPGSVAQDGPGRLRGEWSCVQRWMGAEHPDFVRLVAMVGTVQLAAATGSAATLLDGLGLVLDELFGDGRASDWLRLCCLRNLRLWLGGGAGLGGVLAQEQLLFVDQRLPGLVGCALGGPVPGGALAGRALYGPGSATLVASPVIATELSRAAKVLFRGACGYPVDLKQQRVVGDHAGVDRTALRSKGVILCKRWWTLMNGNSGGPAVHCQAVRCALAALWSVFLGDDVPPSLRDQADPLSLIAQPSTQPALARPVAALRAREVPPWCEQGGLLGLLRHVRHDRSASGLYAARPPNWVDDLAAAQMAAASTAEPVSVEPKRAFRLKNSSAPDPATS